MNPSTVSILKCFLQNFELKRIRQKSSTANRQDHPGRLKKPKITRHDNPWSTCTKYELPPKFMLGLIYMFPSFGSLSVSQTLHLVCKKDFSFICKRSHKDSSKVVQQPPSLSIYSIYSSSLFLLFLLVGKNHSDNLTLHSSPRSEEPQPYTEGVF